MEGCCAKQAARSVRNTGPASESGSVPANLGVPLPGPGVIQQVQAPQDGVPAVAAPDRGDGLLQAFFLFQERGIGEEVILKIAVVFMDDILGGDRDPANVILAVDGLPVEGPGRGDDPHGGIGLRRDEMSF